jgi:hypothetical protein
MEDKSSVTSQTEAKRLRRYSPCLASELSLSRAVPVETIWTASDRVKAGCILTIPPRPLHFKDEGEMRRIYSLIYDVFRCNLSQLFSVNYDCIYVAKASVKIWELLTYTKAAERSHDNEADVTQVSHCLLYYPQTLLFSVNRRECLSLTKVITWLSQKLLVWIKDLEKMESSTCIVL